MNRTLFYIALILAGVGIARADYVTINATFTNRSLISSNFVVNGTTVRYTNAPLNTTTWIVTNSAAGSATNLQSFLGRNYPALYVRLTSATNVAISGTDVQFSFPGNSAAHFAFTTTNSAPTTNWHALMIPWLTSPWATNRTNDADEVLDGLNKYARTNGFSTNAQALTNFLNLGPGAQSFSNKVIQGSHMRGSTVSNSTIVNATVISGIATALTNGYHTNLALDSPAITNATGSAIDLTVKTLSTGLTITNKGAIDPQVTLAQSNSNGGSKLSFQFNGTEFWSMSATTNLFNIVGNSDMTSYTFASLDLAAALFRLGDAIATIQPQAPIMDAVLTNTFFEGTNVIKGSWANPHFSYTTIASGNNIAVDFGTHYEISLDGSISGGVLCGIVAKEGGRAYRLRNNLGASFTLTQNTSDPTAANRFSLYGGLDVVVLNLGFVDIRYNSAIARWEVEDVYPLTSGSFTNAALDFVSFTPLGDQSYSRGKLYYNTNSDSLVFLNNDAQVSMNVGQENWIQVVNNTGLLITNGQACYFNGGVSNGVPTVGITLATDFVRSRFVGFATEFITNGMTGYVTSFGEVNGLILNNGITNGSALYLHPTIPGGITNVPPTNGAVVRVGLLANSNATTGIIFTQPQPLVELAGSMSIDFPSTAAGTSTDRPIAITGVTSNSIVTGLGVPWEAMTANGIYSAFCSNDTVYLRFANNALVTAQDPNPAVFRVLVKPQF